MKHHFHPTILRSYDIRGQVGTTLSTDDAFAIGAGFGQQIKSTSKKPVSSSQHTDCEYDAIL